MEQKRNADLRLKMGNTSISMVSLAFLFAIWSQALTMYAGEYGYLILRGIQFFIYLVFLFIVLKSKNNLRFILIVSGVVLLIAGTYVCYPFNRPALLEVAPAMMMQAFYFMIGFSIFNAKETVQYLKVGAVIALIYMMLGIVFVQGLQQNSKSYDLTSNGLYWIVLFYMIIPKEKEKNKYFLFALAFVLMLLYGRRSHVLYVGMVAVLLILRSWVKQRGRKKLIFAILLSAALVAVALSYKVILATGISFLASLGVNSRTLTMIQYGEFTDLNGRQELYDLAWKMTLERPLLGNGIGSTMVRWASTHRGMTNYSGCNTHNSILEFGAEFGLIGMTLFVLVHLHMLFNVITMPLDSDQRTVLFLLAGTGIVSVLVGSSYLNVIQYAMFLGYYIHVKPQREGVLKRRQSFDIRNMQTEKGSI